MGFRLTLIVVFLIFFYNKISLAQEPQIIRVKKELNLKKIGKIISQAWQLKKNFSKLVTNDSIDKMYNQIVNKSSYGGKLLGAGNGGFILIIFDLKKKKKIIKSLKKYQYLNVKLEKNGTVML